MAAADDSCRSSCDRADVSLAGTATAAVQTWVLVEDHSPWGAKVPAESELPAEVKTRLATVAKLDGVRVQLIRRPSAQRSDRDQPLQARRVFIARCVPGEVRISTTKVDTPVEIAKLDYEAEIERLRAGGEEPADGFEAYEGGALLLVCTHGVRDRCCAEWGVPLYKALAALDPEHVWQCSHLGGHRFAPVVLSLPDGHMYGRVEVESAAELLDQTRAGRIFDIGCLRGRTCYEPMVQAGDVHLRRVLGNMEFEGLAYSSSESIGTDRWTIRYWSQAIKALARGHVPNVDASEADADDETETEDSASATNRREFGIEIVRLVETSRVLMSCGDESPSVASKFVRG